VTRGIVSKVLCHTKDLTRDNFLKLKKIKINQRLTCGTPLMRLRKINKVYYIDAQFRIWILN